MSARPLDEGPVSGNPASTILGIVLGASRFPGLPHVDSEEMGAAFARLKMDVTGWLLTFCHEVCDLFDTEELPSNLGVTLTGLLSARPYATTLVVYYVGHGSFLNTQEYILAGRGTLHEQKHSTALRVADLARTLRSHMQARGIFLLLDCCYAAAAVPHFQGNEHDLIAAQAIELPVGVALLAAASRRMAALVPESGDRTMFAEGLLAVLSAAGPDQWLSLRELCQRMVVSIKTAHPHEAVRPEVHTPQQPQGDIADLPMFPALRPGRTTLRPAQLQLRDGLRSQPVLVSSAVGRTRSRGALGGSGSTVLEPGASDARSLPTGVAAGQIPARVADLHAWVARSLQDDGCHALDVHYALLRLPMEALRAELDPLESAARCHAAAAVAQSAGWEPQAVWALARAKRELRRVRRRSREEEYTRVARGLSLVESKLHFQAEHREEFDGGVARFVRAAERSADKPSLSRLWRAAYTSYLRADTTDAERGLEAHARLASDLHSLGNGHYIAAQLGLLRACSRDEVRSVFDRLHATDHAFANARESESPYFGRDVKFGHLLAAWSLALRKDADHERARICAAAARILFDRAGINASFGGGLEPYRQVVHTLWPAREDYLLVSPEDAQRGLARNEKLRRAHRRGHELLSQQFRRVGDLVKDMAA